MINKIVKIKAIVVLIAAATLLFASYNSIDAQQSSSSNYGINEFIFGAGGGTGFTSANFSLSGATAGELVVGNPGSANFQAYGGFQTTDVPFLELTLAAQSVDFGVLDDSTTGTGTATFSVKTYLASGYSVTSNGTFQNAGGDVISNMTTQAASSQGTSQFGFNLVANTSPSSFGADPVQIPSSAFSFGDADNNYDDANQYRYNPLEQIAFSNSSSGQTDYTIAYIANVAPLQEAGVYTMTHSIIATSTF